MLTFNIKKNKPFLSGFSLHPFGRQQPLEINPPQQPKHHQFGRTAAELEDRQLAASFFGDKGRYTEFVETLKLRFKVGDPVTLRIIPIVLDRTTAPPYYIINDFQEIRHLAQWDANHKEPRCIAIRAGTGQEPMFQYVAPQAIRPLSAQELELVNALHQKTEHSVTPAS